VPAIHGARQEATLQQRSDVRAIFQKAGPIEFIEIAAVSQSVGTSDNQLFWRRHSAQIVGLIYPYFNKLRRTSIVRR
jgi:hypothetical protein